MFNSDNVRLIHGVNIYEYLKWADIHITITSTTSLEAQYFHTPTIFYDYQNLATNYFKDFFKEENGVSFINSAQQFDYAFNKIYGHNLAYQEIFAHDHVKRLMDVVSEYIK